MLLAVIAGTLIYMALDDDPVEVRPAVQERPEGVPDCEDVISGEALPTEDGECWDGP